MELAIKPMHLQCKIDVVTTTIEPVDCVVVKDVYCLDYPKKMCPS
jgi:hypothetical protein